MSISIVDVVSVASLVPRPSATTPRRKIRERKKEGGSGKYRHWSGRSGRMWGIHDI